VPRPVLSLQDGVLQGNTYNVPAETSGHVGMCYDASSGAMFAYANWSHVGGTGYSWMSYPQITYGVNAWDGTYTTYTNQNPDWSLPQTVGSVAQESVWFTSTYSLRAPPAEDVDGYDLSLDDFFTESLPPVFEVGPFVEVEMFLAHNISYPFEWVHWSTPTLLNATVATEPWDVAWWCHGANNGTSANVSFDFSFDGQTTHGLAAGTLGVNLSAILGEVERLMPSVTCWTGPTHDFAGFHLDEANLGSEDGALGGSSFTYNWTVSQYCIHLTVGSPTTSGLQCSSSLSNSNAPDRPGTSGVEWIAAPRD
jgi:hypothetical protein